MTCALVRSATRSLMHAMIASRFGSPVRPSWSACHASASAARFWLRTESSRRHVATTASAITPTSNGSARVRLLVEAEDEQRSGQQHRHRQQGGAPRGERTTAGGASQVERSDRRVQTRRAHGRGRDHVPEVAARPQVDQIELVEHVRDVAGEQAAHPEQQEAVDGKPVRRRERESAREGDERAVEHRVQDDRAPGQGRHAVVAEGARDEELPRQEEAPDAHDHRVRQCAPVAAVAGTDQCHEPETVEGVARECDRVGKRATGWR